MFGSLASPTEHALITTDPSELATSDSVDTDIDLDRVRPLAPLTEPDPGDTATATAGLGDDDADDDAGEEVVVDGWVA
ncbi:hypothetical protein [Nocardia pneumoniae]|uniref:hypothetical protein n=1 Tax=Nocardia pneumoniae TaxID=228601 RepID=UPI000303F873|nr:hypothetical protein [Nocardia pneumoniae]